MKRILVVDDNFEFLQLLSAILKKDFETFEAAGVQEAIKLLETVTVDAICSDYNMRDGTGLDLFLKLRQQGIEIPFMIMSTSEDPHIINEVQHWGISFCDKTSRLLINTIAAL